MTICSSRELERASWLLTSAGLCCRGADTERQKNKEGKDREPESSAEKQRRGQRFLGGKRGGRKGLGKGFGEKRLGAGGKDRHAVWSDVAFLGRFSGMVRHHFRACDVGAWSLSDRSSARV